LRGWACSASGDTVEGIASIEQGVEDFRSSGTVNNLPLWLLLKAEALYLTERAAQALDAINEAESLAERYERHTVLTGLHRLRAVFLAPVGADETQIEASFCEAIRIARSRSRFCWSNALKQPTQNTAAKKRAGQEDVDSDCLFVTARSAPSLGLVVGNPALSNKRLKCKARTLRLQKRRA